MSGVFISAVGTGVGKTYITSSIVEYFNDFKPMLPLKPVISGFDIKKQTDAHVLLAASRRPITEDNMNQISPFRYAAPLSPDQAAKLEDRPLNYTKMIQFCQAKLSERSKHWLIEGVGGVMAPLTEHKTNLDWMNDLKLPVILVTGSYLGALSHTLTAYHALASYHLDVLAVVINESSHDCVGIKPTQQSLSHFLPDTPLILWQRGQKHIPGILKDKLINLIRR